MAMEYEKTSRNTVNRLGKRGAYDYETVHRIIDSSPILHVAFNPVDDPDGFPTVLPMLGCTAAYTEHATEADHTIPAAPATTESTTDPSTTAPGAFPSEDDDDGPADTLDTDIDNDDPSAPRSIYLHGWVSARLLRAPGGTRVCVSAAHVDGAVLALAPFHNSANYRSAVAYGLASPVTDARERDFALRRITDNFARARWAHSRGPPTNAELTSTGVLRVDIESASAKVRVGGPNDDRADLADEKVAGETWIGVVPMYTVYGTPIPGPLNRVAKVPAYIEKWREESNREAERYAVWAVTAGESKK
uniref:Linoleate diol synthase n=1 Tax=Ganoderma boninense TaxID=34458 RepID=A0A5K1K968_9APHY|nr:Linoleate diol synthase [Ganoderma boninense]